MSVLKSIFRVIGIVLLVVLALLLLWAGVSRVLSSAEQKQTPQEGSFVTAYDGKMNVSTRGEGSQTIVLMPGLGTASPVLDFAPLMDMLAENYRVVIAEPFGYGWSELTHRERSAENIVEELRLALSEAGEPGPYVLMPHSVSGIYAAWYAEHYPAEVSAIIGIDCTLPRQVDYFGGGSPSVTGLAKLVNPLGISRLLCMTAPATFISDNGTGIYTEENLQMQKLLASRVGYNRNVIDEMNMVGKNIDATRDIVFDAALPLLFITRTEASHTARDDGKTSRSFYDTYIMNPDCQQILELDAGHYMHWAQSPAISEAAKAFLDKTLGETAQ